MLLLTTIIFIVYFITTIKSSDCPNKDDFQCNNEVCINKTLVCNNQKDCDDNSDELIDCDSYLCRPPHWFQCMDNINCISNSFRCDNSTDCPGGEDEINCFGFQVYHSERLCTLSEFTCSDKMCIPNHLMCDGKKDCFDNSDETIGCQQIQDKCSGFLCDNKHCLESTKWLCDGHNDCGDNSDENNCIPECTIEHKHYLCKNNHTCIELTKVCNDVNDCEDESDEHGLCKTQCKNLKCPGDCQSLPSGPICICSKGFEFNNITMACDDINECNIYGICSQGCTNTLGSYKCTCKNKFKLRRDGRTCSTQKESLLLFTTVHSVNGFYLESHHKFSVAKNLSQVIGVSYDETGVYWSDISYKTESIVRSLIDGSKREILLTSGLGSPEDLCVDWLTGNIYFTDSLLMQIAVCSNDGYYCTILLTSDLLHHPRGIALHPMMGQMYWSDWGRKAMIGTASMDGTNEKPFVTENIFWPNCITLDWPNERLYWADAKLKTLESVMFNGKNRRTILGDILKHPYGIAVYDDKIYWSDWETQSIQTCDKFTGKDHETVLKDKKIYDIHIYNTALMPREKYPCNNHICSHLCLLNSNLSYSCGCPQGMELSGDKLQCKESEKKNYLLMGIGNYIVKFQQQIFGKHEKGRGDPLDIFISKMEYNSLTGTIFVADNIQRIIYTVDLKTANATELISHDIGNVSALAFDYLSNNLYWTDSERSTIEMISLNKHYRTIIQHYAGTDIPIGLALMPETGYMYVALRSFGNTHIDKFTLNGHGPHYHVIEENLGSSGMFTFAVDTELETVFWSDMSKNTIESTDFDGETRHIFQSKLKSPVSMVILGNEIYWTSRRSRKLYWAKKYNPEIMKKILIQKPSYISFPNEIILLGITPIKVSSHLCITINGGCSHICVTKSTFESTCLCPLGMIFDSNSNLTCIETHKCEFKCISGECLSATKVCDGQKNCADNSDEIDCKNQTVTVECSFDEFRCADGKKCIDKSHRCDMNYNCEDKSDEDDCDHYDHNSKCRRNQFSCPNGLCIDVNARCDDFNDCGDNSDEQDCDKNKSLKSHKPITCGPNMFRCTSGQCIAKSWECDGETDCTDASDEHNKCPHIPCPDNFSKCTHGHCIDSKLVCDGHNDCGDNSDEDNCDLLVTITCDSDENEVPTKFQCLSDRKICLDLIAKCNGTAECPRGEDEVNCTECTIHEFQCQNKRCIRKEWKCDNENDCGDGSDEKGCILDKFEHNQSHYLYISKDCKPEMFNCKDGYCIDASKVCDGVDDCENSLDESGKCNISCIDHPCKHNCSKTPFGPVCSCNKGFQLAGNKKDCIDINECRVYSPCAQKCDNTEGSFRCSCYPEFMLRDDKLTCKSMGPNHYMLFSSYNQIRKLSENPSMLSVLWTLNETKITGMDVNMKKHLLYFTVKYSNALFEYNLLTNTVNYISNIGKPTKLTVDWITNNVYFIDNYDNNPIIKVCHMNGKKCARIINLNYRDIITAIVVDPINKLLFYSLMHYWTFNRPETTIYKCNLDGQNVNILVKNVHHVTAITIDINKRLLYFTDMNTKTLQSVKYDGTEKKILIEDHLTISQPTAINVYENNAYIMNLGSSTVSKCKLYGENRCILFDLNVFNAEDMVIVQESRQKSISDTCAGNNCTVICVAAEKGPKCLCHNGKMIKAGEECENEDFMNPTLRSFVEKPIEQQSSTSTALKATLITFWTVVVLGLIAYVVYKKRIRHGRFNVSMHFQNPTLTNPDPEVKMYSAPKIFSSRNRNELCLETNDNLNKNSSYSVSSTVVDSSYNYSDVASLNEDNYFDDNPTSSLLV